MNLYLLDGSGKVASSCGETWCTSPRLSYPVPVNTFEQSDYGDESFS